LNQFLSSLFDLKCKKKNSSPSFGNNGKTWVVGDKVQTYVAITQAINEVQSGTINTRRVDYGVKTPTSLQVFF
jgi:hypothetical protein